MNVPFTCPSFQVEGEGPDTVKSLEIPSLQGFWCADDSITFIKVD